MVYPESDEAKEIYKKYIQFYSDFHLHKQRENWSYVLKDSRVSKRIFRHANGFISKFCLPKYDEKGRCGLVKIVHHNSEIQNNETVQYIYDEKDRISGRVIDTYDGIRICEEYQYLDTQLFGTTLFLRRSLKSQAIWNCNPGCQYLSNSNCSQFLISFRYLLIHFLILNATADITRL